MAKPWTSPPKKITLTIISEMRFFAEHTSCDVAETARALGRTEEALARTARRYDVMDVYRALAARSNETNGKVPQGALRL